jgi:hypothetical protein
MMDMKATSRGITAVREYLFKVMVSDGIEGAGIDLAPRFDWTISIALAWKIASRPEKQEKSSLGRGSQEKDGPEPCFQSDQNTRAVSHVRI